MRIQLDSVKYRHAKHYANRLASINSSYRSGLDPMGCLTEFDNEQAQIEQGYKWASGARHTNVNAAKLCEIYPIVGGDVLMLRHDTETLKSWNITGLEIVQNHSPHLAGFLANLGWAAFKNMEYTLAEEYFLKATKQSSENDLRSMSLNPYSGLASIATEKGYFEAALQFYAQALAIWQNRRDVQGEFSEYGNISVIYARLKNNQLAHEYAQQAVVGLIGINDIWRAAAHLNNLGTIYIEMEQLLLAVQCFTFSMQFSAKSRDKQEFGRSLAHLASVQIRLGHLNEASESIQSALSIAVQTGDWKAYNMRLITLAHLEATLGNYSKSFDLFKQGIERMRENGKHYDEAAISGLMGKQYAEIGDNSSAIECFKRARDLFQKLGLLEFVQQADRNIETLKKTDL